MTNLCYILLFIKHSPDKITNFPSHYLPLSLVEVGLVAIRARGLQWIEVTVNWFLDKLSSSGKTEYNNISGTDKSSSVNSF
jgi:hypothetical protein